MSATPREPAARAERRYLIATAVNIFGTGVQGIAVPWLLLELTGTAAAVGVLLILRALPAILLSSWAGALCDAGSRRRIAIASSAAQGAATLAAAAVFAAGYRGVGVLYALTLVVGTGNTFFGPATRAYMQLAVGPTGYQRFNSLTETATMVGLIAGTAVGGPLLGAAGVAAALAIDGATFLWAAAAFVRMREIPPTADAPRRAGFAAQRDGLRYIAAHHALALATALALLPVLCIQVDNVLVSAYVREVLGLGADVFSEVNAAYAVGAALVGAVLSRAGRHLDGAAALAIGLACLGAAHAGFGASHTAGLAIGAMFAIGVTLVGARATLATRIMEHSEPAFAGRVQAAQQLLAGLVTIALGVAVGGVAEAVGYRPVFLAVAALCGLGALGVGALARVHRRI